MLDNHQAAQQLYPTLTSSLYCRDKEQLAEGLHLIDFEQLKIENQSLNEKIEERNDELIKLRKKTTVTVQVPAATTLWEPAWIPSAQEMQMTHRNNTAMIPSNLT